MWRRGPSSAQPLEVTAKARKPYQPGIMGRWITSLSRRPLRLHTFFADPQLLVEGLLLASLIKNSVKILIVAHVFKPEMYSPMLQMTQFISHPSCLFVRLWLYWNSLFDPFRLVQVPCRNPVILRPKVFPKSRNFRRSHRSSFARLSGMLVIWKSTLGESRPSDKGAGGAFGPQFGLKIRWAGGLTWIRHWSKLLFLTQSCCFSPVLGSMVSGAH